MIDYRTGPRGLKTPRQIWDAASLWVDNHPHEFAWYIDEARRQMASSSDGKASPNSLVQSMRRQFGASLPNQFGTCFARIASDIDPGLAFRVARSTFDRFRKGAI